MKFRVTSWGASDVAKADTLGRFLDWKLEQPFEHENIFMLFTVLLSFLECQERIVRYLTEGR